MNKNQRGVTMVALVIIIIVMIIISGIIIYEGTDTIEAAKNQSIYTNMLLIQAKARTVEDKYEFEKAEYIGKQTTSDVASNIGISTSDKVYTLSQDDLYEMGVEVSGDNEYVVNYEIGEVYYIKGIKDKEGNIYHSLTEISNLDLNF